MRAARYLIAAIAAAALAAAPVLAGPASAATWWQPGPVTSWQWQLTWPVSTTKAVQVYDIDYDGSEQGTQAQVTATVATLHSQGRKAICYLETGSWENYRPDAGAYAASWLGANLNGYPDERYVKLGALFDGTTGPTGLTLRQVLDARFAQCAAEGFDGVETDLDATYADTTGITRALNEQFNEALAADIHGAFRSDGQGLAWFIKNGVNGDSFITDQLAQPAASAPDGTVNEQCNQYAECSGLQPFVAAGKPILNAEYAGKQASVCPSALAFPMATARFPLSLNGNVTWHCWP